MPANPRAGAHNGAAGGHPCSIFVLMRPGRQGSSNGCLCQVGWTGHMRGSVMCGGSNRRMRRSHRVTRAYPRPTAPTARGRVASCHSKSKSPVDSKTPPTEADGVLVPLSRLGWCCSRASIRMASAIAHRWAGSKKERDTARTPAAGFVHKLLSKKSVVCHAPRLKEAVKSTC
jgi:hypothetical protein